MNFPNLSLVLGGAASGKSAFAERLVVQTGLPRTYIATAQAFDAEMRQKIAKHQQDRGPDWTTIEAPLDLQSALNSVKKSDIILIDCLTLWLSNTLLKDDETILTFDPLLQALSNTTNPILAVSNEGGHGIIPTTPLGRRFQSAQGRLNQQLAAQADLVVMVTAGLPQTLKGQIPGEAT